MEGGIRVGVALIDQPERTAQTL